jgi:hypothetical protein
MGIRLFKMINGKEVAITLKLGLITSLVEVIHSYFGWYMTTDLASNTIW